ncbi:MAG: hypothetical protein AVDCRST_MAG18-3779 [uncultured Thermomicrobiales bacterium]|uniref:DUF624 domain-containing protein n=1 Tax=uncultured Thermomicrobiales bacterium TaxID=1645740 RepID=A0A6J4VRC3_9BACT|nr:MAG: hypothetical protein AVDCRST_MAG18-3779 [uncultured Thermomicrobiales bacterium]
MKILDSRLYRLAETITNYFLLNLLWALLSLPLLTVYPATVALFSVLRTWRVGDSAEIVGPFFAAFRAKLGQSLLLGLGWTAIGIVLGVDLLASRQIPGALALPVLVALGLITLLYCQLSVFLFPTIAHIRTTPPGVVRNAFLLALSQPFLSLFAALGLIALALAAYFLPFLPLLFASPVAYGLDALFRRGVARFAPGGLSGAIEELNAPDDEIVD